MTGPLPLHLSKRRVAVAGKVLDAVSARPIGDAAAVITSGPAALPARTDRAVTAADGCFCFLDLPDGAYTVSVAGPPGRYYRASEQSFIVQRDAGGNIAVTITPIALSPTGVRGKVQGQGAPAPLSLARVRVEGGDDLGHCDAAGLFYIAGVQPGARRLSVSASGYHRGTVPVEITAGAIVDVGVITLQPAGA